MNLKFYWGDVSCPNLSQAAKMVARELDLSPSSAYLRLRAGERDFSTAQKRVKKSYKIHIDRVIPELQRWVSIRDADGGTEFVGTAAEIFSLAREVFPTVKKSRVYRRLRRNIKGPLLLSALCAPPMPQQLSARIGGRKTGRKTETLFSGVEGHDKPIGATALYHEWNPPIGRKELYIRLKAGYKRKADLTCRRLSMAEGPLHARRGRPRKIDDRVQDIGARPAPQEGAIQPQEKPIIDIPAILERADAFAAKNTSTLPPMRDYVPPKPYVRGS